MVTDNHNKENDFNGKNEKAAMDQEYHEEHDGKQKAFTKTENKLSMGDSIRNFADVNGTTFGPESNPAKFGHMGDNNQQEPNSGNAGNNEEDNSRSSL